MENSKPDTKPETLYHLAEAFGDFIKEFEQESDRAAVVLGTAKLDSILHQLLQKVLLTCTSSQDELLEGERAPIGTFSARVILAYRLGLIDSQFVHTLHLIRRIRNDFAHETSSSLETGPNANRIRQLVTPFRDFEVFKKLKGILLKNHDTMSAGFRAVLALTTACLEAAMLDAKSVVYSQPYSLTPLKTYRDKSKEPKEKATVNKPD